MNNQRRLSLQKKMSTVSMTPEDVDTMMCNQESQFKYEEDVDFSLDLTKECEPELVDKSIEDATSNGLRRIIKLMDERNELSRSKECLKFGKERSENPPWMKLITFTSFKVSNDEDTMKFNDLFKEVAREAKDKVVNSMVQFLDREITSKEEKMKKVRNEVFESFPPATKGWREAKKGFDKEIQELTNKHARDLVRYRDNLVEKSEQKKERRPNGGKKHQRGRGHYRGKFRPY